jgi:HSP20 family protein
MTKDKKPPEENEKKKTPDMDFGIGRLSLGGLFEGIEKIIDLAAKVKESGNAPSAEGETSSGWKKEGEIDLSHLKEGMKGVFGFSVKAMAGREPVVEPFGNIKKTPKGPVVEEEREPIIDIFDEKDEVKIYAEMPGVREEDIKLDFPPEAGSPVAKKVDIIIISAKTEDRKYHKEILLPAKVRPETLTSVYKNGILEVKISKSTP